MQQFMKALAWTFVHSLWLGLLAALLAAIIISATRKTKANLRYNLLGLVFVLFLVATLASFFVQVQSVVPNDNTSVSTVTAIYSGTGTGAIARPVVTIPGGFMADITIWFNNNTGLLLLLWSLFFAVNCLKLFTGLAGVHRLRHYKTHSVSAAWEDKFKKLSDRLGIRQSVTLLQSELVKIPVALGFLKPVILLPVGLLANIPAEQVEVILLHELGHIRRKDYLVNFFQRFAEAIFFFNPAIIWISSLLRQEREACCDDIVVEKTGQKRDYLNALVSFQEYSLSHQPYAMGFSSRREYLLSRVKRMITNENKKLNLLEKTALLAGIVLFSAFTTIKYAGEISRLSETIPAGQIIRLQQPKDTLVEKILRKPESRSVRIEKRNIERFSRVVTDTVPRIKDKKLPTTKDWEKAAAQDPQQVLREIQVIKDQIGVKKESIGEKKKQLEAKQGKNAKEEQQLKIQIEKERSEIEGKRAELDNKRALLDYIKKQQWIENEKKQEEKNQLKNEEKHGNKQEIKKEKQDDRVAGTYGTIREEQARIRNKNLIERKIKPGARNVFASTKEIKFDLVEHKEVKYQGHVPASKTAPSTKPPPRVKFIRTGKVTI